VKAVLLELARTIAEAHANGFQRGEYLEESRRLRALAFSR